MSALCPRCRKKGKSVNKITLEHLIKENVGSKKKIIGDFLFCSNVSCETVYYSEDGKFEFFRDDVKIRIGQKEILPSRQVCYCFNHTVEDIDNQIRTTGSSTIFDDIKISIKKFGCNCETMNPQGSCCLGNVRKAIKETELKYGDPNSDKKIIEIGFLAQISSIVAAVLASACCWLPLVLMTVGISGGALSAFLGKWRPVMIPATFILLGIAFFYSYRKSKSSGKSYNAKEENCCPANDKISASHKKRNRKILWFVSILVIILAFIPDYIGVIFNEDSKSTHLSELDDFHKYIVKIEGMTCESCASQLKISLESIPNISNINVNYEKGVATIRYEGKGKTPDKIKILEAIENLGYKGSFL